MKNSGIPYFPLDCRLDCKFELIEAEFGLNGFGIVVKLFQEIYGVQGYYLEWTNEVALLFARRAGLGGNVVSEIVSAAIKRGIFDQKLFEKYHILTSAGIQMRYFDAVSRRKQIEVTDEFLLVDCTEICKNVDIQRKSVDKNAKNVCNSSQRKEKEKREEERKEKNLIGFDAFWEAYPKKKAKEAARKAFLKISPDDTLLTIMLRVIEKEKRSADWKKENGKFIPYPATWLNGRRWEDDDGGGNHDPDGGWDIEDGFRI